MGGGSIVGELTFYLDKPRTASVIVNKKTIAYQLNRSDLEQMKTQDPDANSLLHEFIACVLSERLVETDQLVKDLTN